MKRGAFEDNELTNDLYDVDDDNVEMNKRGIGKEKFHHMLCFQK